MQYKVTYNIKHTRIFDVPDEHYITEILCDRNDCEILSIEEVNDTT